MRETEHDIVIVGGSLGGAAAALRAAEFGARVLLLAESGWIGGQLTSQGVCTPDENPWIERGGGTASYQELRRRVRDYYSSRYNLSDAGAAQEYLNPGSCWVSRISAEPRVWLRELQGMLAPHPNLEILYHAHVGAAEQAGADRIDALNVSIADAESMRCRAAYFLDATDTGDLLPMAGVEYTVGAESREATGEPDAPPEAHPEWVQPFTFPFALELLDSWAAEEIEASPTPALPHVLTAVPRPQSYEQMAALQQYHVLDGAMRSMFGKLSWWNYRRVLAAANFADPRIRHDVAMVNTGSNDFRGGVIPSGSSTEDARVLGQGRLASLGYAYWLQTECPRDDGTGGTGYPELMLRGDLFGTPDGIAPHPYIRESRRIRARKTVLEQEIVAADSSGNVCQAGPRAALSADSCGIGHYWLDIHAGGTDEPGRFLETRPFQIPLGALIPVRVANVLPACKNLGVTHLTSGAYRLHPIEWNVGESAGALAAFCVERQVEPRAVFESPDLLRAYQARLLSAGVPIFWWGDLSPGHGAFMPAQRLAMAGLWPGGDSVEFRPDHALTQADRHELDGIAGRALEWPPSVWSRADAAIWLDREAGLLGLRQP